MFSSMGAVRPRVPLPLHHARISTTRSAVSVVWCRVGICSALSVTQVPPQWFCSSLLSSSLVLSLVAFCLILSPSFFHFFATARPPRAHLAVCCAAVPVACVVRSFVRSCLRWASSSRILLLLFSTSLVSDRSCGMKRARIPIHHPPRSGLGCGGGGRSSSCDINPNNSSNLAMMTAMDRMMKKTKKRRTYSLGLSCSIPKYVASRLVAVPGSYVHILFLSSIGRFRVIPNVDLPE